MVQNTKKIRIASAHMTTLAENNTKRFMGIQTYLH